MSEKISIPPNVEHYEAFQASIDAHRAEHAKTMAPEEQEKLKVIEQAAALLEAAKIPFALYGCPYNDRAYYYRFNKLDYLPDSSTLEDRFAEIRRQIWILGPSLVKYAAGPFGATHCIAYGENGENGEKLLGYDVASDVPSVLLPKPGAEDAP